jgi:hypothetical protein
MKLLIPNSSFNFLLGLTILVICGFYTSTTAAHPLSTLLNTITSSASFGLRAANIEESDELSTISRTVAKRDLSFSFNTMHVAFMVIILALVVGFVIWCKCAGRKNSQAKDMGDEDSKEGTGGMCVMM